VVGTGVVDDSMPRQHQYDLNRDEVNDSMTWTHVTAWTTVGFLEASETIRVNDWDAVGPEVEYDSKMDVATVNLDVELTLPRLPKLQ